MREITPARVEAFSDGVIAIIITIMVLELKLPDHASDRGLLNGLVLPLLPKFASYAMSFLVVAIMWVNHHALMITVRHATRALLWHNNHLLFWMSLIPITTEYIGQNPRLDDAYAAYGFILATSAGAFTLLRWSASLQGRDDHKLARVHRRVMGLSVLGTALYSASVPLAYLSIWWSIAIFIAVPVMFFLPIMTVRDRAGGGPLTR